MLISLVLFFSCTVFSQDLDKQYPEDRSYTSADRGMGKYAAKSLYQSGKFALTFDDGPHSEYTPRLLDVLKEENVQATFFVLTNRINDAMLPLLKRILDEGHILASHSKSHDHSNQLSLETYTRNLKDSLLTLKAVYEYAGHPWTAIYYRYPYGEYGGAASYHHMNVMQQVSQELFGDNCIQFVFWDVDTADWVPTMTSDDVLTNLKAHFLGGRYYDFKLVNGKYEKVPLTMKTPPKGGVILQHDIHEKNIEATRHYIRWARTAGVELVTLPEVEEFKVLRECRFLN